MMQSNTQLIANKAAMADPWKREKIENIAMLLQGALRADRIVGLKMNVSQECLDTVINMLPSLHAPTVAQLYKQEGCRLRRSFPNTMCGIWSPSSKRTARKGSSNIPEQG
jgi:ATP phosphoribosyltransferase